MAWQISTQARFQFSYQTSALINSVMIVSDETTQVLKTSISSNVVCLLRFDWRLEAQ